MNCPTRDPEPFGNPAFNQNPPVYDNELTTNRTSNSFEDREIRMNPDIDFLSADNISAVESSPPSSSVDIDEVPTSGASRRHGVGRNSGSSWRARQGSKNGVLEYELSDFSKGPVGSVTTRERYVSSIRNPTSFSDSYSAGGYPNRSGQSQRRIFSTVIDVLKKYSRFIGPGFMISVAYIDPGNYSTDVAAGAQFRFRLLFVVLLSNIFAIFLQSLCAKLGSVTGLDLAQNCREHFPRWLCIILYVLAEVAIVATDLAEVIGTAISLNILFHIPLVAGVAITIVDVLIVLFAYRPNGSLKGVRWFEYAVATLVLAVVICFCVELGSISGTSAGEVLRGYLPSKYVVESEGLYLSCGILGATVMPHSLYLGSGLVQPRLREYDEKAGNFAVDPNDSLDDLKYRPSLAAIRHALTFSIVELAISLFTFALFVNSAILVVAGATLSDTPGAADADLFSIHDMLSEQLSPVAGTVFALALLFSGQSAGIVCTLAGQMVSEGFLHWTMRPWLRRLITRGVAILPCIVVAGCVGRSGLSEVLNLSQVILSILLPFVSAPLIYFTCRKKFMMVPLLVTPETAFPDNTEVDDDRVSFELGRRDMEYVDLSNNIVVTVTGVLIWLFISGLNVYLIVLLGMGKT
ncbi:natural resistance-associated macrophage protein-domain-containing protein [Lipomyces japonicus]|uniref:natural resistance-associated macrophage protein-domain-containing protein n=1 Tax=Lipomyces japonicus TaxID=56871 RepID=UPI0034CECE9B